MTTIFNPLNHLSMAKPAEEATTSATSGTLLLNEDVSTLESNSAFYNEVVGVCPKCGSSMKTSKIATGDNMFFCPKDRVVLPLPNNAVGSV